MSAALEDIRAAVQRAGGSITFEEFQSIALYGDHGFYTLGAAAGGGQAGRRGDFLTSPEVGPLFGTVIAAALRSEWERLGRPDDFTVVEVGAGPGTLARAILSAARDGAADAVGGSVPWLRRYVAVEVSAAQRALHPPGVESAGSMPDQRFVGVVLANELLDNLPFGLAVFDGCWRRAAVAVAADGSLSEVLGAPLDPLPPWLPARAKNGARVPLQAQASAWVAAARSLLIDGRVMAIDYCTARTAELALRPWRQWLRTYRGHERGGHYLDAPGSQDITSQVSLDQLPEPDVLRTQAQFLQRWGIDDLVTEGRAAWASQASAPSVAALRMRSRVREAEALLDPNGLGSFTVVEWSASAGDRPAVE